MSGKRSIKKLKRALKRQPARQQGITIRQALRMVEDFRLILSKLGVDLPEDSTAAKELCAIDEVMGWIAGGKEPPINPEYVNSVQNAVCAIQLVELVVRRYEEGVALDPFIPHFRLLKSGSMRLAAESGDDDANHKLFELLVGLVVSAFGKNVRLAHPFKKDTSNPDVVAEIDGLRWGFACKVPHSRSIAALHDNILKGLNQIDEADVDSGVVALSPKNILTSASLLPLGETRGKPAVGFFRREVLRKKFIETFDPLMADVNEMLGAVERKADAKNKRSPFAFWLFTTATIARVANVPRPTLYAMTGGWQLSLPAGPVNEPVVKELLDRIQVEFAR